MFPLDFYSAAKTAPHYRRGRGQSSAAAHDRYLTWIEHLGKVAISLGRLIEADSTFLSG